MAATTAIGVLLSSEKKKRAKVYSELYEFNERMLLNLRYGKERISQITADYKFIDDILAGKELLAGEDATFLKEYGKNLGSSDCSSQIEYLSERQTFLRKMKDESMSDYKKYSSLYIKIALMAGILIAVLLA